MNNWSARRVAVVTAACLAAIELLSIVSADVPIAVGLVFALLFGAAALLTARAWVPGVVLFAVLCLLEVAGFFLYERGDAATWVLQVLALLLGAVGLIASGLLLARPGLRSRQAVGGAGR